MDAVVMCEFGKREMFGPRVWIFTTIDAEIGFKFLIHAFCLSISLGMICGGKGVRVLEKTTEF